MKAVSKASTAIKLMCLVAVVAMFASCKKDTVSTNHEEVLNLRNNGADMPAYVYGNAASKTFVIIVHGGPGGNGLEYRSGSYVQQLEQEVGMIYWDQRGQGMSHGAYSTSDVTIDQMADDLRELVRVVRHRYGSDSKVYLLGHSWGGTLTAAFMTKGDYQHSVDGWIESNGAHDLPSLNKNAVEMFRSIGRQHIADGINVADWEPIVAFADSLDPNNISIDAAGQINGYGHQAEGLVPDINPGEGFAGGIASYLFTSPTNPLTSALSGAATSNLLLQEVEAANYTPQLKNVTIPCLFIGGKYDFVVPPALAVSAYNEVSSSQKELVMFEHSGHSPMDNEADKFVKTVLNFVEKN